MSPLGISLLLAVAFAGFGILAARKLRIVAALGPAMRWDRPLARLGTVVTNGFLQMRMIGRDWRPGLMHAAIFLGFLALLARKIQLIVIGYHEPFVYPGVVGGWFAAGKDVVEIMVLVALAYDGKIWLLRDSDHDGIEDKADLFWDNASGMRSTPIAVSSFQ